MPKLFCVKRGRRRPVMIDQGHLEAYDRAALSSGSGVAGVRDSGGGRFRAWQSSSSANRPQRRLQGDFKLHIIKVSGRSKGRSEQTQSFKRAGPTRRNVASCNSTCFLMQFLPPYEALHYKAKETFISQFHGPANNWGEPDMLTLFCVERDRRRLPLRQ